LAARPTLSGLDLATAKQFIASGTHVVDRNREHRRVVGAAAGAAAAFEAGFLEGDVLVAVGAVAFGGHGAEQAYAGSADGCGDVQRAGVCGDKQSGAAR
jgi:hypothetical protein